MYSSIQQETILNSYDVSHVALDTIDSTVNKIDMFPDYKEIML